MATQTVPDLDVNNILQSLKALTNYVETIKNAEKKKNSPTKNSESENDSDPYTEDRSSSFDSDASSNLDSDVKNSSNSSGSKRKRAILEFFNAEKSKNYPKYPSPIKPLEAENNSNATNDLEMIEYKSFDVKNDCAFKDIIGSEGSEEIAMDLANAVFNAVEEKYSESDHVKLTKVCFPSCDLNPKLFRKKQGRVDIIFADQDESLYLIEMQRRYQHNFLLRVIFYINSIWIGQDNSDDDSLPKPVSVIIITESNFFLNDTDKRYLTCDNVMVRPTGIMGKSVTSARMVCINLAKFDIPIDLLKTDDERWCFFVKNPSGKDLYDINKIIDKQIIMKSVIAKINLFFRSSTQVKEYQQDQMASIEIENELSPVKDEGRIEGRIEGKIEIALKLIRKNGIFPEKEIAKVTGLSLDHVRRLTAENSIRPMSDIPNNHSIMMT